MNDLNKPSAYNGPLEPSLGVALGKGEVGDRPRPHLKIRPQPKFF